MWDTYKIDKIKKSVLRRMEALPQTTDDETALYIKRLSEINETPISDDTYDAFFLNCNKPGGKKLQILIPIGNLL